MRGKTCPHRWPSKRDGKSNKNEVEDEGSVRLDSSFD